MSCNVDGGNGKGNTPNQKVMRIDSIASKANTSESRGASKESKAKQGKGGSTYREVGKVAKLLEHLDERVERSIGQRLLDTGAVVGVVLDAAPEQQAHARRDETVLHVRARLADHCGEEMDKVG